MGKWRTSPKTDKEIFVEEHGEPCQSSPRSCADPNGWDAVSSSNPPICLVCFKPVFVEQ